MSDEVDSQELAQAIQNLSRKKHVITNEALKAKEDLDLRRQQETTDPLGDLRKNGKNLNTIEEFNYSVRLLTSVFQQSKFDELVLTISNPSRILILNFCIGLVRGLGFLVGAIVVLMVVAFMVQDAMPNGIYAHFARIITIILRKFGWM